MPEMDEFSRRQALTGYVTVLKDSITQLCPDALISEEGVKMIESSQGKEQVGKLWNEWFVMTSEFMKKIRAVGSQYPIEEVLGIKSAEIEKF